MHKTGSFFSNNPSIIFDQKRTRIGPLAIKSFKANLPLQNFYVLSPEPTKGCPNFGRQSSVLMIIKTISHNSSEYRQIIQLRIKALLEPIGVPAHYIVPEKQKHDLFIAAFAENKIIGGCVLTPKDTNLVQLRQMAVHPDWQGKKIGAAIVRYAEETAREKGFGTLMLHARNPVIDFYRKCGYEVVSDEIFEVGIGHHKMQKQLP